MNPIRSTLMVVALSFAAACASSRGAAPTDNAPKRDRNVITQEEIDASKMSDAYNVVRALHPGWLLGKTGGSGRQYVQVYVEGNKAGDTSALQQYNVNAIREIRYLSGDDATTRFGTGNAAGAIIVFLKR